jgi:hypothetical protein
MRHFLAQQGIDQAGFADVRSAEKSEFRRTFRGKEFGIGSGGKKFGDNRLHSVINSLASKKPPGTHALGRSGANEQKLQITFP